MPIFLWKTISCSRYIKKTMKTLFFNRQFFMCIHTEIEKIVSICIQIIQYLQMLKIKNLKIFMFEIQFCKPCRKWIFQLIECKKLNSSRHVIIKESKISMHNVICEIFTWDFAIKTSWLHERQSGQSWLRVVVMCPTRLWVHHEYLMIFCLFLFPG